MKRIIPIFLLFSIFIIGLSCASAASVDVNDSNLSSGIVDSHVASVGDDLYHVAFVGDNLGHVANNEKLQIFP